MGAEDRFDEPRADDAGGTGPREGRSPSSPTGNDSTKPERSSYRTIREAGPAASTLVVDLGGIPTSACPMCGCTWLVTAVNLDPDSYEIVSYMLQGVRCFDCGTLITLACPPDHPDFDPSGL